MSTFGQKMGPLYSLDTSDFMAEQMQKITRVQELFDQQGLIYPIDTNKIKRLDTVGTNQFEQLKGTLDLSLNDGDSVIYSGDFNSYQKYVGLVDGIPDGLDVLFETDSNMIKAPCDAEVASVFTIPGAGKVIMLKQGSYRLVFSNVSEALVSKGDLISKGSLIGVVKNSKDANGFHVELWKSSEFETKRIPLYKEKWFKY